MVELHERSLVCQVLLRTHRYLSDGPGKRLPVLHFHHSCPSQLSDGAQMDFAHERCCVICSSRQVPPSSAAMLPAWMERFISPSLFVQVLNVLILFFSSLPFFSPVQFSLNFITAFLPSVSVHPHSSTLTLNGKDSLSVGDADNRLFHN